MKGILAHILYRGVWASQALGLLDQLLVNFGRRHHRERQGVFHFGCSLANAFGNNPSTAAEQGNRDEAVPFSADEPHSAGDHQNRDQRREVCRRNLQLPQIHSIR